MAQRALPGPICSGLSPSMREKQSSMQAKLTAGVLLMACQNVHRGGAG